MAPSGPVLGIETSCDETGVAVYDTVRGLLAHGLYSQVRMHAEYGGVVPELASRDHVRKLLPLLRDTLARAGLGVADLAGVAYTAGPGLVGALLVGAAAARSLAWALGVPAIGVHHMEGHLLAPLLEDATLQPPFVALLVSGGHTMLIDVAAIGRYRLLGDTLDDAAGEAFDKTAKLIGLPYPGGPNVEKAAARGDSTRFDLPRPLRGEKRPDFSFSGLKTAVRQAATAVAPLSAGDVDDIAASFQRAIVETLRDRVAISLERFHAAFPGLAAPALVVAGGVAANKAIRAALEGLCQDNGFRLVAPPLELCTDNGAMIAWAGLERLRAGLVADDAAGFTPRSRWPLDEQATPLIGTGRRGAKA